MNEKINNEKIWDEMAADYDGFTSPEDSYSNAIEWAAVKQLLPPLGGRRVLDIGCGSGRFTYYFAEYGPEKVVGVDQSEQMLEIARSRVNGREGISFLNGDAGDLSVFRPESFDFVFSSTTLHYVADLNRAYRESARVLKRGGDLMFSVIHPLYSASYPLEGRSEWELRYLDRSMREYIQPWTRFNNRDDKTICRSCHHTLADYINPLIGGGFSIRGIHEPEPPAEWRISRPKHFEHVLKEPIYMIIIARKMY